MGSIGAQKAAPVSYNLTQDIFREDKEGWMFGKDSAGSIWIGTKESVFMYEKDTPENRQKLNDLWKANSFAREIKRRK